MISLHLIISNEKKNSISRPAKMAEKSVISSMIAALQLTVILLGSPAQAQQADRNFYARPGVTAAQIIRARGFLAEEHFITSQDGYVLKLTRATHPKINGGGGLPNRAPILFVHGILEDPTAFVINSFYARPKDFFNYSLSANPDGLVHEASAKSLPFLAMNFGHEVWLLSRRGTPGSQKKVGNPNCVEPNTTQAATSSKGDILPGLDLGFLSRMNPFSNLFNSNLDRFSLQTFTTAPGAFADHGQFPEKVRFSADRDYWNYSLDEQAAYDFPQSIKYVLEQTGREKLSVVGHSAGGAITLMALSLYPELADRISRAVLWSQGFSVGKGDLFNLIVAAEPFFDAYMGPIPPVYSVSQLQSFFAQLCATSLTQRTLCTFLADKVLGPSGGQEPIYPEFMSSILFPTCSLELAQALQTVRSGGNVRMYDYGPAGNLAAYGQLEPPPYDASRIRLRNMSFYVGATDVLVSPSDVSFVLPYLTVPHKFTLIERMFNHQGYFFHDDNAQLVIIPSLIDLESSE